MTQIGKIIRQIIQPNRDATVDSRMFQVQGDEPEDSQEIESIEQSGVQSRPPDGADGIFSRISAAFKVLTGFKDGILPFDLQPGERVAYSSASGAMVVSVHYKADGSLDIVAPGDVNITGNLNVTGDAKAGTVAPATTISLLEHPHLGNLGFNTSPPVIVGGGVAPPNTPPSSNSSGDIIDGGSTNLSNHTHTQTNDSGGDSQQNTGTPA